MSRYRAHSETCDQTFFSVRRLSSEICCLVFLGHPLWWEVGSVICLSLSTNLPLFTSNIYITCVLQFSNLYTINIKLQSVPSEYSRLCCYVSSNILQESKTLEQSYRWPPPSLSLLCFLCGVSPWPILRTSSFSWLWMIPARFLHNFVM
jgi:hypothetical protein